MFQDQLLATTTLMSAASFCDQKGWKSIWKDDFTGTGLDPAAWTVEDGHNVGTCRSAYCSPNNVAVLP